MGECMYVSVWLERELCGCERQRNVRVCRSDTEFVHVCQSETESVGNVWAHLC